MKSIKRTHDLTGQKFGKLTVIGIDDRGERRTYWYCQCDCGNITSARSDSLLSGGIRSCGCLKKEQDRINLTAHHSHKQSGSRLYYIWSGMKSRCYNPHNLSYANYGGRGITVCPEWKDSFSAFYNWALSSGYSESLTIDRIDNSAGYSPDNCHWATAEEQCNNRRSNINIKIGNSIKTLTAWCKIFDVDYHVVVARYKRGLFGGLESLFADVGQYRGNQQTADTVERSE